MMEPVTNARTATLVMRSVTLLPDELVRLHALPGRSLIVARGTAWITQAHCPQDWILAPRDSLQFKQEGLVLVNAVGGELVIGVDAALRVERVVPPAPKPIGRLREALERIRPNRTPGELVAMAPAQRRTACEREARRLRAQVVSMLLGALVGALADTVRRTWESVRRGASVLVLARTRPGGCGAARSTSRA